ncbi:MAG: hypothetical protein R6V44_01590 [Paracoccaceae bacterium]
MPRPLPAARPHLDAGEIRQRLAERHGDYLAGAAFAAPESAERAETLLAQLARMLGRSKDGIRAEIAADWNAGA